MFYVYAYLRTDGTPYYIGKGRGKRAYDRTNRRVKGPKDRALIIMLETELSEKDALSKEREYILKYGRKDINTGILRNMSDGGENPSGYVFTEEHKRKLREARAKQKPPNKGMKLNFINGTPGVSGPKSDETKLKMRLAKLGKPKSAEHKKNISLAQTERHKKAKYKS